MDSSTVNFLIELLSSTLRCATPIALAAIGATICERSGIVNIAMEGMMVMGAFFASIVALYTKNPWMGLFAGIMAGGILSLLHAFATVTLHMEHVVSGAVINVLAFGLARFFLIIFVGHPGSTDSIPVTLTDFRFAIPFLSKIPFLGPILFNQTPIIYMTFFLIIFLWFFLFHTKAGLHIRAAGEHPLALETIGVSVFKMRYLAVFISGLASGLAGAYLSIEHTASFSEGMTNGRGFIALAAMISGGWNPIGAFIASLFFGFADAAQLRLQLVPFLKNIPSEIFQIFPYAITVIAIAGLVRKSRPPKAIGTDFMIEKESD